MRIPNKIVKKQPKKAFFLSATRNKYVAGIQIVHQYLELKVQQEGILSLPEGVLKNNTLNFIPIFFDHLSQSFYNDS
jgi:hypothetical protein